MFRKLTTILPIAIVLGAVLAAPAVARTRSHVVKPHPHTGVLPATIEGDAYSMYGRQPSQGRLPGETRAFPFTQDPRSPQGW